MSDLEAKMTKMYGTKEERLERLKATYLTLSEEYVKAKEEAETARIKVVIIRDLMDKLGLEGEQLEGK